MIIGGREKVSTPCTCTKLSKSSSTLSYKKTPSKPMEGE